MTDERKFTPCDVHSGDRLNLRLSDADWARHDTAHTGYYNITDTQSGEKYRCRKVSCGIPGCNCDAEAELIWTLK